MQSSLRFVSVATITVATITAAALLISPSVSTLAADVDPFAAHVRPTPPLTGEQERLKLQVPAGFEVQLVAAEPDIQKPMNMAFDARGRLWVTCTLEYPFPVGDDEQGRDTIKILEDTTGDGRADRITTFADGLNIPFGLYPQGDRCIVYSIPNIYLLEDSDGDGRADRREVLYGPTGVADTHGMQNAFRRNFDGWLNICHGFSNTSTLAGADQDKIKMQSGNTYRVRLDGSRVEQVTWGQVNPFGATLDARGNMFTADCHSVPITQLLRGGHYPSFGKPHDGLGYAPPMMRHLHGSTAISGIVLYEGDQFPVEYHGDVMVGNVMTSRVNRDTLEYDGSTITAHEADDFLISHDPWFRPVDLQIAPDGSLYVADFYNRIIGHYEVPLDHPGRDRERGRIWRIVYTGKGTDLVNSEAATPAPDDLSRASADALIAALAHPTLTTRLLATHELVDRVGPAAITPASAAFSSSDSPHVRAHALWVLQRLDGLDDASLIAACDDAAALVRIHAMRVLGETPDWSDALHEQVVVALGDDDAFVRRAAAAALARHPNTADVHPLLDALSAVTGDDRCLEHAIRIALRNVWRESGDDVVWTEVVDGEGTDSAINADALADVAPAVPNVSAGEFLVTYLEKHEAEAQRVHVYLYHAARYLPVDGVDRLVRLSREGADDDVAAQARVLRSMQNALDARNEPTTADMRAWAVALARDLFASDDSGGWRAMPTGDSTDNPWAVQRRDAADGARDMFLSTLTYSEEFTGVLRSPQFNVPETLSFYLAGHDGEPDKPAAHKNLVRIRDAETRAVLAEAFVPRQDTAQLVEWTLAEHTGQRAYLEIVDGLSIDAFAWIAVGRFDPPVVVVSSQSPHDVAGHQAAVADIVARYSLNEFHDHLATIATDDWVDLTSRGKVVSTLAMLAGDNGARALGSVVSDSALGDELRDDICAAVAAADTERVGELVTETMKTTPAAVQARLAEALASTAEGADTLLSVIELGQASPRLLGRESLRQKVIAARPDDGPERVERLVADLPPRSEELDKLIAQRRAAFDAAGSSTAGSSVVGKSAAEGKKVFTAKCAVCHQLGGEGKVVGPQLDGIGARGLDRLVEDIVDPNRNVDAAFRSVTFVLDDGRIMQGLPRSEDADNVVIADNEGKEIVLRTEEIEERAVSPQSLMPENLVEQLTATELNQLLAYLLTQRTPGPTAAGSENTPSVGGQ